MADSKDRVVLTTEGLKKLEAELEYLRTVRRNEVAEQIAVARGFGDLSENAEYDEAKNEQSRMEAHIVDLENMIRTAVVIDDSDISTNEVGVGTSVLVMDMEMDEEITYDIVGVNESDPAQNKISNESPVGATLIGRRVGEIVPVEVPDGVIRFKILDIFRK